MQLEQLLQMIGLSSKEAKVYLACLELWPRWASTIARKIWENRVTTYDILKKMKNKWLVSDVIKNWTHIFSVISPKILLEKYKKEEAKKINSFENLLPEFENLQYKPNSIKPIITFYEWLEWIKNLYEDSIWSPYQDVIISKLKMSKNFEDFLYNHFVPERIKRWMKVRVIHWKPFAEDIINNVWKAFLREVVCIDHEAFNIWNVIFLHNYDKTSIVMFSEEEMSWFTVKSKILHDTFKSIFEMLRITFKKPQSKNKNNNFEKIEIQKISELVKSIKKV